ncbi:MAG: glycosyl hydrolase family 28-related protein [Armatimonadota bacterium]|nr:glycosyl hydrolase family 28-related protein [Armatimonadota bacterium]
MSIYGSLTIITLLCTAIGASAANMLDVKQFGVKGDGKADDSAAIQRALDACAANGGGTVKLPAGKYKLSKPITVPSGVMLAGEWEAPHHAQLMKGTVILAYADRGKEDGPALVTLSPSSGIKGMTFFYPMQRIPGVKPYPWTIRGYGMHCSVIDVTLVNSYKGIDFATEPNELHYIRNVFGCPLKIGIAVDKCTDIGRIENVHFNPHYWMRAEVEGIPTWQDLRDYLLENCTSFEFGRTDWEYVLNTFSYGCKVGMRFYASKNGACNGNFLGCGVDWARTAVLIEQTQEPGLLFTNGEFVGADIADAEIEVAPGFTGVAQFSNCAFWGPTQQIVKMAGDGFVSFSQCNFQAWDRMNNGTPALEATKGSIAVHSCRFGRDLNQIKLGSDVKTATIIGNTLAGPQKIENQSKGDVQISMNVSRAGK